MARKAAIDIDKQFKLEEAKLIKLGKADREINELLDQQVQKWIKINERLETRNKKEAEYQKILPDTIKSLEKQYDYEDDLLDLSTEIGKIQKENLFIKKLDFNLDKKIAQSYVDMKKKDTDINKAKHSIVKLTALQFKDINQGNTKIFRDDLEMLKIKNQFPTLSKKELKLVEQSLSKIKNINTEYIKNKDYIDKANNILKEQSKYLDEIKEKVNTWVTTFKTLITSPKTAFIAFMGFLSKKAYDFADAIKDAHKVLGLSLTQMTSMAGVMGSSIFSSSGFWGGVGIKTSAEAFTEISNTMGGITQATKENVIQTGKLMSLYGLTATEATTITRLMKGTSKSTLETAKNLARSNGIPIGAMMREVANNAELFALSGKKGGENIFKASITAKKLGLELSNIAQIQESLLGDPTDSIEKEMNASVMLGKQLNLQAVRQKMYDGDHAGAMQDLMKQMGGITEWNKMDMYQKKSVADLLGLQVDEVMKMYTASKDQAKLTNKIGTYWDKIGEKVVGGGSSLKEWGGLIGSAVMSVGSFLFNFGHIAKALKLNVLWQKIWNSSMLAGTKLSNFFMGKPKTGAGGVGGVGIKGGIKPSIGGGATPDVGKGGAAATGMFKGMGSNMGNIVKGAAAIAIMAGAIYILAQSLKVFNEVDWMSIPKGATALGILVAGFWGISQIMSKASSQLIMGAFVIGILGAALIPFGVAMSYLAGIDWKTLMMVPIVLGAVALEAIALGAVMMSGFGAVAILAGAGAIAILGASMIPLGVALEKMGKGLPYLTNFMKTFDNIRSAPDKVADFFDNIANGIYNMTNALGKLNKYENLLDKVSSINFSKINTMDVMSKPSNVKSGGVTTSAPTMTKMDVMSKPSPNTFTSGGSNNNASGTDNTLLKKLNEQLDMLIEAVNGGAVVKIDGVEFLRYLTKVVPAFGTNSSYTSGKGKY
jgi:hypothetical protein